MSPVPTSTLILLKKAEHGSDESNMLHLIHIQVRKSKKFAMVICASCKAWAAFHPLESNASWGQDGAQSVHATYFCLGQIPLLKTVRYTKLDMMSSLESPLPLASHPVLNINCGVSRPCGIGPGASSHTVKSGWLGPQYLAGRIILPLQVVVPTAQNVYYM
jgi:hypothetical protein